MMRRKLAIAFLALIAMLNCSFSAGKSGFESFNVRPFSANEFYVFVKVFSEMRAPLRKQILKDSKTNFEDADPLKYVMKVKGEKDVKKMLKENDISWDAFTELMGNVVLAYFSIQPEKTKASLIRQLADYGLTMSDDQIPPEYQEVIRGIIKTDEGATMASAVLEFVLQIPEQNVTIAKENKLTLDKMFYTRMWRDKLE
jgi:hypothetical protein